MAAGDVTLTVGTQVVFANHAGDFAAAADTSLAQAGSTNSEMTFVSLADTAARQSDKIDLGANRAEFYSVMAAIEFAATPTTGALVEFYWAPSNDATSSQVNIMGVDDGDGAAPLNPVGSVTLAEFVAACQHIGNFKCTNDATTAVQVGYVGTFSPAERYGILVVKNESGAATHSDDVETHVSMTAALRNVAQS